ncbi:MULTISPECIES: DNA polymerase I [unclassified Paenibacillus]|uniref:DNA polymerase I n=1 Tax=unclassified Paenibacillus TaxID=185978 RepID=UPI001AE8D312|nr:MULTISPECIES: DNA polymerase I [unclassified Paenibacillus]MBP1154628.1 DNA polymerase-1 [Paenibacillus sp. PvP091]MBP1169988.1 DNA polymerase-1 [Paenibacillus sp. PvR098]MBP2441016.1 DNA polymerase-1 [Paenibacillus sp. PvP052]
MSKLILIDGNSIAYRAFFALPLLSNSKGLHTNAVYGFTTMLLRLLEEQKPTHFLVAFDAGKATFRHKDYAEYKGGREKTPPELSEQFPVLRELLESFGIRHFQIDGYEADDIIGTLTRIADKQDGMEVLVVTGDKDMLQLASERVKIALTRKGISEVELYDPAHIEEKYGLKPLQIIDLKGLMGDTSDNIPGIPGVGEKTALKLLHEYGSVENVLENASKIKGKMGEKVAAHTDDARMSKELATIFREVPVDIPWDELTYNGYEGQSLGDMFRKLEFKSLLERLDLPGVGSGDASAGEGAAIKAEAKIVSIQVTPERFSELVEALPNVRAMHVEVIGDNPHTGEVLGLSFYSRLETETDPVGYYLSFDLLKQEEEGARSVREWLADENKSVAVYDLHRAVVALFWQGLELRGVSFDVLLAGYLLDPTESALTLHGLCARYGLPALPADEEVFGKGAKFKLPEAGVLSSLMCRKALTVQGLAETLQAALESNGMNELLHELELPLALVLASMERKGIKVDVDELKAYGAELGKQLGTIMQSIYDAAGTEFNINSPKQLGEILFEKLQLPVIKKTKTGYSTDAEVLEKLEPYHPMVGHILHYRTLAKIQSTYVEGLLKEVRPDTGKVHTYYKQTIAATGRLSSQYPNLQNIPIRLEEGRKIRKVFKPSEPGWHILTADYSQIELRVLAHISQDEKLIEAFQQNMDIHTKTAMDVFGVPEDSVDSNMRRQAKAVNFGIVYGISDYGLSQNLNITRKDAAKFIEQYFAVFQGVRQYMDDIVKKARQDGYVTTLLHRRRYLPEITASNFNLRSFAERTAMNTPIQGTAADIIKLAMVQLDKQMKETGVKSRLLLQVHDELVLEVPEDELETMKKMVAEVMESALPLDVPLKVDVDDGENWYEAK